MVKMTAYCDFCNQPMPEDGNDVLIFRTKEIDTKELFPHLCENCATKIDKMIKMCTKRTASKAEILAKMTRINAERRALLSTKG